MRSRDKRSARSKRRAEQEAWINGPDVRIVDLMKTMDDLRKRGRGNG